MPVLQTKKMSQNGHEERSGAKRARATNTDLRAGLARPVLAGERRPCGRPQHPPLPLLIHISTPQGRTLPHLKIRPVCATSQRYGHRQYLRISRPTALLRRGVGAKYPLFPRTPSDRPGRVTSARLVGTVRPQRVTVFHALTRGTLTCRCGTPCVSHGGGPCGGLHGPHTDLPRASGKAEGAPRRLGGVLLSEGDRPLHDRCLRPLRRATYRKPPRKIPMRPRRVLPESIPQPADAVRQAAPPTTLTPHRQLTSHRTTLLRPTSRQNAHRNPDKRHALIRELVLLALHGDHVTYDVAAAGSGMIHALRLSAVPAKPEIRPVPKVPARDLSA